MKSCVFLSMDSLDGHEAFDHLAEPFLAKLGWQVDTISWRKPGVDWSKYDLVVVRTPWDYQQAPEEFLAVLEKIETSSAQLQNGLSMMKWNIDKQYLAALEKLGVNIVPTIWRERLAENTLTEEELSNWFHQILGEQLVIKPRVSANADHTFWLKGLPGQQQLDEINSAFRTRDMMIQPFMPSVTGEGEFSLFYFNGQYSHAILKTPKDKDFRVQEDHGGRIRAIEPELELTQCASTTLDAIAQLHQIPLYARLDFVRSSDTFALMEAELIEPSLYFNYDAEAPKRFADAIEQRFSQHQSVT